MYVRLAAYAEAMPYLVAHHYLHRPVVRSKTLSYFLCATDDRPVGCMMWATPHFTKKRGLFGFPGTYDKWEVLVLARMYLEPGAERCASQFMAEALGRSGRKCRSKRRGWRLQQDWCRWNPPKYPDNPYVPRLLLSWSDDSLRHVERCVVCGAMHNGQHRGTIYEAMGWTRYDETTKTERRGERVRRLGEDYAHKVSWTLTLAPNAKAEYIGELEWMVNNARSATN